MKVVIVAFLVGFIFNDGRLFYKIFGSEIDNKYKLILKKISIDVFLGCIFLNFFKGFFIVNLTNKVDLEVTIVSIFLFLGNYLGSKPGVTGGSELIILWGIWFGFNYKLIQIPFSVLMSLALITKNWKISYWVSVLLIILILLINRIYCLLILSIIVILIYFTKEYSLFSGQINKIKEKLIVQIKGV